MRLAEAGENKVERTTLVIDDAVLPGPSVDRLARRAILVRERPAAVMEPESLARVMVTSVSRHLDDATDQTAGRPDTSVADLDCLVLKRRNLGFVFLDQIGGLSVVIEPAFLISADPDADQVARDVMLLRKAVQRLAGNELLRDLAFELNAVSAVLCHGLSLCENPASLVSPLNPTRPPSGAHSISASKIDPLGSSFLLCFWRFLLSWSLGLFLCSMA